MEFKLEQDGDVRVALVCSESLSANNVKDFKSKISDLLGPNARIVLDMRSLKFVDSSGIGALVSCANNLNLLNGSLRLCNLTTQVRNLFEMVRVQKFFQVFDSREEAVNSFDL
jgi:anti-sigma B factor antagonist